MGCENFATVVKIPLTPRSKKTRPSIKPPDGNPVHRVLIGTA